VLGSWGPASEERRWSAPGTSGPGDRPTPVADSTYTFSPAEALDPLEWLACMSDHIPDPRQHRTLFYGEYANRVRGAFGPQLCS
jgi:hypothetical protein